MLGESPSETVEEIKGWYLHSSNKLFRQYFESELPKGPVNCA